MAQFLFSLLKVKVQNKIFKNKVAVRHIFASNGLEKIIQEYRERDKKVTREK